LFFKDTHLPEMLRLGRSRIDVSISNADDDRQPGDDQRRFAR